MNHILQYKEGMIYIEPTDDDKEEEGDDDKKDDDSLLPSLPQG